MGEQGRKKGVCEQCGNQTCRPKVKQCNTCKGLSYRTKKYPNNRDYYKDKRYRHKYGIGLEGFNILWEVQNGKCKICNIKMTPTEQSRGQSLTSVAVDHNHITNKVRGLLCRGCNQALGLLKDNPEIIKNAAKYVEEHLGAETCDDSENSFSNTY